MKRKISYILILLCLLFSLIMIDTIASNDFNLSNDKNDLNTIEKDTINHENSTIELFSEYEANNSIDKYLIPTENAQSNSTYINELSNEITKDYNTTVTKTEAIVNWVTHNISYSAYSDTKYGGEKTLKQREGNCIDTSHALVSLLRAEGIPARYVYGECEFTKGELAGTTANHVWVQVLINDEWVVVDGIYEKNELGYVCNWNSSSYELYGHYNEI